ncbi:hypothetical protein [Hymenobacter cheonanensis]|uniref:hypothetical protein n=1 Tax=Hymenobacter sp. CA2-7 TaxID=3063993 RepID=UPI0027126E51|nr:hypothetical protein [Hymenobacter sp. CA2-7]MDO7887970.1 hypothetical protein [Hymenobacter sp. CA2-7]
MTLKSTNLTVAPATAAATLSAEQADTIASLVLGGDLSKMDNPARVRYYVQLCQSLSLNPHTQPFQILKLSGKEVMYATKSCTEQLRKLWGVSVTKLEQRQEGDVFVVVAYVVDSTGRTDAGTGAVPVTNLKGEALANAFMKAETKAKRRATLSICGLGMLDESELDTLPQATAVHLPAATELGTGAEVVQERAAVASPLASVEGEPLSAQTRKLILLAVDAFDANHAGGEGYEAKLVDNLDTLTEQKGKTVLAWLEKQPKKKAPKTVITQEATTTSAGLVQQFRDRPTLDGKAPVVFATDGQKQEIKRLIEIPVITRPKKTTVLLFINRLDTDRAHELIEVLNEAIQEREGGAGAAALPAAA